MKQTMKRGKFTDITGKSLDRRIILLIIGLLLNYLLLEPFGNTLFGSRIGNWVQPSFWLGIGILLFFRARVRVSGKNRYQSFLRVWAFVFALLYIGATIIGGLLNGFGYSPYSHSISGILQNIFQIGTILAGREIARSFLVNSFARKRNIAAAVFTALLMAIISLPLIRFQSLHNYQDIFVFSAQYLAPEICLSLMASYLVYLGGPAPSIIFLGTIQVFQWISPVLPDMKWITAALIGIICPLFSLLSLRGLYAEETRNRHRLRRPEENPVGLLLIVLVAVAIIWFAVGVFPLYPTVVATGSMEPVFQPGDVLLIQKIKPDESLQPGEIIQFRRDNMLIAHRIVDIVNHDNKTGYRTKGDNNAVADSELVQPEDIKGRMVSVIPKIGWPSLLFKSNQLNSP